MAGEITGLTCEVPLVGIADRGGDPREAARLVTAKFERPE
jgi:hypothetical protein